MPDPIEFSSTLEGFDTVMGGFKLVGSQVDAAAERALISAAEWAVPIVAANAPVGDDPAHAGTLRDSIGHSGVIHTTDGPTVVIGSGEPYARRIELGFHGADSLGRNYEQEAQPFIEPVLDQLLDELTKEVGHS